MTSFIKAPRTVTERLDVRLYRTLLYLLGLRLRPSSADSREMAGLVMPQNILFLFLFFLPAANCRIFGPRAVLFTYQSQHTGITDWFEMLTLCLAPLIAHVAGGAPTATLFGTAAQ